MADLVNDIKSRLSIEEVVSQYVQLKKSGRNFKGLCPFHSEKTPSFIVSPEKQICHCFGCNKGGDIFSFVQELEGVSFIEAMEILADRAGVKIDLNKLDKKAPKSEKDIYFKAHELACKFFEEQLYKTNDGKKVLEYLHKRGLSDLTIEEFRLGFAPDKYDELYPYLLKKGIPKDVLFKSGLISAKNLAADTVYDKYRARLMFPIFDNLGKICGFGGRTLKHDQMPKYLNSSENLIYNKSRILYGLSHSKKYIKESDQIVLVEGYFDVILPYQAGIKNVVATSGTALSDEQIKVIKRLTLNVVSCFDTDEAGVEATRRAYLLFQHEDILIKTVTGLDQKDPADFVLTKGEIFKEFVNNAKDFITFFIEKLFAENEVNTLSGRRKILKEILPYYYGMPPTTKDFCVKQLAERLKVNEQHLYEEIENYKLPIDHPVRLIAETSTVSSKMTAEDIIFGLLLEYPSLFKEVQLFIDENNLTEWSKSVYKDLTKQYNAARENFSSWDFDSVFLSGNKAKIDVLRLYIEENYLDFSEVALRVECGKLIDRIKKDFKVKKLNELQLKITEAEEAKQKELIKELLKEQQTLLRS